MRLIDCVELLPKLAPAPPRAASTVLAKDTVPYVEFLAFEPRGTLLVIEAPNVAKQLGRLLRRGGPRFEVEAELPGLRGPGALSPGGRWLLTGGELFSGQAASCQLIDLHTFQVAHTLPLMRPFVWIDEEHFIAQSPNWTIAVGDGAVTRGEKRRVDPALATAVPSLVTPEPSMVRVSLSSLDCQPLLPSLLLDEETCAVLSPDQDLLYTATSFSRVSAVRVSDGQLLWQRPPSRLVTEGTVYAMALDSSTNRLVTVGNGVDHDTLVLDAKSGDELSRHSLEKLTRGMTTGPSTRGDTLHFREDGLGVIGTNNGLVIEIGTDGRWCAFKAGTRSHRAIAFSPDGTTMMLGGAEKNLRVVPLTAR
ncbi:PQQ-like beta-propeller repeat protein [Myxococcus sp. K38C18041901]|uniref:PQQ-like beta-propeller repeat protein n=1 Tax=Myxococcus guangdongensis TaxID=2906760 RepID=UPI0020A81D8E|nr:PQQ-like beta-propeller repeat protein [Myxococcus guangdongensis]MCP3063752.1 PQQ-like beta-propeller repeat protein [Myxococcus guangdongensis]